MKPIMWGALMLVGVVAASGASWWALRTPSPGPRFAVQAPLAALTCDAKKAALAALITTKNYCETDADCATEMACPFGCQILVNKAEVTWLRGAIAGYHGECGPECKYKCAPWAPVTCVEHQCVAGPK